MSQPILPAAGTRSAGYWSLAILSMAALAGAARAQEKTADVKPGASSGEILLTSGHHVGRMIPHESDEMPLGCYGCLTGGGGGCGGGCDGGLCGGPGCVPGRLDCCEPCEGRTIFGR